MDTELDTAFDEQQAYRAAQAAWITWCQLRRGDRVRLVATASTNCRGWSTYWNPEMSRHVGQEMEVVDIDNRGIHVTGPDSKTWIYPFFVLVPALPTEMTMRLNSAYSAQIDSRGRVQVGCQTFTTEKMKEFVSAWCYITNTDVTRTDYTSKAVPDPVQFPDKIAS